MQLLRSSYRLMLAIIISLLVSLSIISTSISFLSLYVNKPGASIIEKTIILERGTSLSAIAKQLASEQIIEHPRIFLLIAYMLSPFTNFKAGEYFFTCHITPKQIINMLIKGEQIIHSITIPEGLNIKQIITRINQHELLKGTINLQNVQEGWLLPSTYFYSYGDKKQTIINRMQNNMNKLVEELWNKRDSNLPYKTKEEALTLASIVEKEAFLKSEQKTIAAVFINRLKKNMKLQADPTTIYAVTKGEFELGRPLNKQDLKMKSEFNTYYVKGLPPHPIASPGKSAIEAVFYPDKNEYLFFVVNGNGGHNFSTNLLEHNNNVGNFLTKFKNKNKE